MNIQDLGSIGELIAAIATLLTLGYLAIQLKQNTSALKSQTFQQSSMDMSLTANSVSSDGELAKIIIKAENGISSLSSDEKLRFHFWTGALEKEKLCRMYESEDTGEGQTNDIGLVTNIAIFRNNNL